MVFDDRKDLLAFVKKYRASESIDLKNYSRRFEANKRVIKKAIERGLHASNIEFYEKMDGLVFEWESKQNQEIQGNINILHLDDVLQSWKDIIYFDEDSDFIHFVPIDFFQDEACVGTFIGAESSPMLYLYRFDAEAIPLYLNLNGYVDLAIYAKGFLYWQYAILAHLSQEDNLTNDTFKAEMPKIFPEFDFHTFIQMYEDLKIQIE